MERITPEHVSVHVGLNGEGAENMDFRWLGSSALRNDTSELKIGDSLNVHTLAAEAREAEREQVFKKQYSERWHMGD